MFTYKSESKRVLQFQLSFESWNWWTSQRYRHSKCGNISETC